MKPYRGIKLPEGIDGAKVQKAVKKLLGHPIPVPLTSSCLLPLTPREQGFVLGVLYEAHATEQEEPRDE